MPRSTVLRRAQTSRQRRVTVPRRTFGQRRTNAVRHRNGVGVRKPPRVVALAVPPKPDGSVRVGVLTPVVGYKRRRARAKSDGAVVGATRRSIPLTRRFSSVSVAPLVTPAPPMPPLVAVGFFRRTFAQHARKSDGVSAAPAILSNRSHRCLSVALWRSAQRRATRRRPKVRRTQTELVRQSRPAKVGLVGRRVALIPPRAPRNRTGRRRARVAAKQDARPVKVRRRPFRATASSAVTSVAAGVRCATTVAGAFAERLAR